MELTSKQRKILEKFAQPLSAGVLVGGGGVTPEQIKHIETMFSTRELIKVKFNEYKDEKRDLSEKIAAETGSTLVRLIGNVAILYKESDKDNVEHLL